jgi:DNA-binding protein HU-beta
MIRADLIERVQAATRHSRRAAAAALEALLARMVEALAHEQRIELRGFGVWRVRPRKPGMGRNPKTGAAAPIRPGKRVCFAPGRKLHALPRTAPHPRPTSARPRTRPH